MKKKFHIYTTWYTWEGANATEGPGDFEGYEISAIQFRNGKILDTRGLEIPSIDWWDGGTAYDIVRYRLTPL